MELWLLFRAHESIGHVPAQRTPRIPGNATLVKAAWEAARPPLTTDTLDAILEVMHAADCGAMPHRGVGQ
jgi:hypothetical protein